MKSFSSPYSPLKGAVKKCFDFHGFSLTGLSDIHDLRRSKVSTWGGFSRSWETSKI